MELKRFFRAFVRRWYLILIPLILVTAYVGYNMLQTPAATATTYTTELRFSAAQATDILPNSGGDFQDIWLSSELTVNALTSWAVTSSFKNEVARRTAENGLIIEPETLPIVADNQRSIGQLFISWPNAAELEIIAQAAINVLEEASQEYFPQFGNEPAQVTVLDEIRITPVPMPLADTATPLLQIGLALVAGFGLALLAEYLDPTLHTHDEVETIGFDVIASVPKQ